MRLHNNALRLEAWGYTNEAHLRGLNYNTVQLRIFGTDFRPVETRNFASLPRILGLTERYWAKLGASSYRNGLIM
jgi:hypothetical protein